MNTARFSLVCTASRTPNGIHVEYGGLEAQQASTVVGLGTQLDLSIGDTETNSMQSMNALNVGALTSLALHPLFRGKHLGLV